MKSIQRHRNFLDFTLSSLLRRKWKNISLILVNTFSYFSTWLFFFSFVAVISFISLYFYQLPTHHCPFDLLQGDYNYIGYPLYLSLFAAGITGAGTGVIDRFKDISSLKSVIPGLQKRLCLFSMIGFTVFTLIATYPIIFSGFILEGY